MARACAGPSVQWPKEWAEMLKKEASELKNFFKELDLGMEASKNEKSGEADLMLFLSQKKT